MNSRSGVIVVQPFLEESKTQYQGFDGNVWPDKEPKELELRNGLACFENIEKVKKFAKNFPKAICKYLTMNSIQQVPPECRFLGVDIGWYEWQWSYYSCTYHEVIFGMHSSLTRFRSNLNNVGLFSTSNVLEEYVAERNKLVAQSADLERLTMAPEDPYAICVYEIA